MINNVVLVGRLTKDPVIRVAENVEGKPKAATFTLAVNRPFKNSAGEREADFIQVVTWNQPAEFVEKYIKKGNLIGIEGSIQTRTFDPEGKERIYITEVRASSVTHLEPKKETPDQAPPGDYPF